MGRQLLVGGIALRLLDSGRGSAKLGIDAPLPFMCCGKRLPDKKNPPLERVPEIETQS